MDGSRARLDAICLALPEVERTAGQHVTYRVRGSTFAYHLDDHHGDGIVALCCKAAPGEQAALVAADPDRFLVPAYLGGRGWVSARLDVDDVDWSQVAELARESYRLVAPKRLAALVRQP